MASTKAWFRELISREIGGYSTGTVDLPPSTDDADAMRSIYATKLSHVERPPTNLSFTHVWIPRYNEGRQVVSSTFVTLPILRLTPPASGPMTLTFWGYGETDPITLTGTTEEKVDQLATAIQTVAGLETVDVVAAGTDFRITLPSIETAAQTDAGSLINGIGQVLVSKPFRSALPVDTAWEMSAYLPIEDDGGDNSLNWIVNRALSFVTTIAQVPYHFTDEDRRTDRDRIVLLNETWLDRPDQIHGIWKPFRRILETDFTPPISGTFDLELAYGLADPIAVAGLAYDASNETITTAISEALAAAGRPGGIAVEGTSTKTIRLTDVYYAEAALTASSGTIANQTVTQVEERMRFDDFKRVFNRQKKTIELTRRFQPGESFEIEMSVTADRWTCPQVDYETLGTTWSTTSSGLVYDLDQADASQETVKNVGSWLGCLEMAKKDDDRKKDWLDRAKIYSEVSAELLAFGPVPTQSNSREYFSSGFTKTETGELRG